MISRIEKQAEIEAFCRRSGEIFAVKQLARSKIYGKDCDFWLQTDSVGKRLLISRLSDAVTVCGEGRDLAELRQFLLYLGGAVEGSRDLLEGIQLPGVMEPLRGMMAPIQLRYPHLPLNIRICIPERLSIVYDLLCESDEGFAANTQYDLWLTDFSHRCRHGFSQCFILLEEDRTIATISILFCGFNKGIAGSLAVKPSRRRRGYGNLLLDYAVAVSANQGQRLYLLADMDRAGYYRQRGWIDATSAARCILPAPICSPWNDFFAGEIYD